MLAVKSVTFRVNSSEQVLSLLETFRDMVNEATRIGYERKPKTRFQLISMVYGYLNERYNLHTHYILSACECAFAMLRNKKWKKKPYAKHLFLKLDNQTYQLNYMMLRIPVKPREFIIIPLKGGDYQLSFLRDPSLKRGSITLTANTLSIAFSKEVAEMPTLRKVGLDTNERVLVSSDEEVYDLSKAASCSHQYSKIMASVAEAKHNDRRVKQRLLAKYGERKRNRIKQALHKVSKIVVEKAKSARSAIVLEKLTHIRQSHRKGNGEGRKMRGRLNRWPFHILQSQIQYKAVWEGIPVEYVRAANTSKRCSNCGYINKALKYERAWQCPSCGVKLDRDLNAARNILTRSWVKEVAVVQRSDERLASEAMEQLVIVSRS